MAGQGQRGDRVAQRQRAWAKARVIKAVYEAGEYEPGSYHRETKCEGCHKTFPMWRTERMRFCSRVCAGLDRYSAEERADITRRRAGAKKRRRRIRRKAERAQRACDVCGVGFQPERGGRYCGVRCARLASAFRRNPRDRQPRACVSCEVVFAPSYGDKRKRFCSDQCAKRYERRAVGRSHKARARYYGVEYQRIDRIKVFERDGWVCCMCKGPTPKGRVGTLSMRAPELDHVIPLSKGGAHTWANVQCACRRCNLLKGNSESPRGLACTR